MSSTFLNAGASLHSIDTGSGTPVVFLHPTRLSAGHERYAVLGGPHGRFALDRDVYRQECFQRGAVVEVAEMPRDRFESVLSEAIRPPTSSTP